MKRGVPILIHSVGVRSGCQESLYTSFVACLRGRMNRGALTLTRRVDTRPGRQETLYAPNMAPLCG